MSHAEGFNALTGGVEESLDPEDWGALRQLGHRMVDDLLAHLQGVREGRAWTKPTSAARTALEEPMPKAGLGAEAAYSAFRTHVQPFGTGNLHPRFWGWVIGTGSPLGALAEMLAAGMNPNVGGFDDGASLVEDQVLAWFREAMGFPTSASGLLVSGGSMANLVGLAVARHAKATFDVRRLGQGAAPKPMVLYASRETHSSVGKAVELLGLGREALRLLPVDDDFRLEVRALEERVAADRALGLQPFAVVGNAGTVNTGAIDDLPALAGFARREGLHFHVDGAVGALGLLSPALRERLRGVDAADSLAFDPHKWGHFPIEAGCVLVREGSAHRAAFQASADYLARAPGGLAARTDLFSDLGPQLSRGFKALKIWMGLQTFGADKLGRLMAQNVAQAAFLADQVERNPDLELLARGPLHIVCFRHRGGGAGDDLDALNRSLLVDLQESGIAVPSGTLVRGRFALRVCINNHRTRREDLRLLVKEAARRGRSLAERTARKPQETV